MRDFKKLEIWQFGFEIANKCFELTDAFSKYHQWGIGIQINKSAVSIPSNVAEGNGKSSEKDKKRFMEIARGSSFELETQLLISKSRKLGDQNITTEILELVDREQKMLMSFINLL